MLTPMSNSELPISQAAHLKIGQQQNIFSTKLTNETKKKKSSTVEMVYLQRNPLIEDLKNVPNQGKLLLIRILLDVKIANVLNVVTTKAVFWYRHKTTSSRLCKRQ